MPHNISLSTHRYVYIVSEFVLHDGNTTLIPAVWFGVGATPQRSIACHVLLENGAMLVDIPLHALRWKDVDISVSLSEVVAWDCYGWNIETYQPEYISGLSCEILDSSHKKQEGIGTLWFAIDFINNGFSDAPQQHKHLWIVARNDGALMLLPQDRLLIHEASFTEVRGIPKIKRQDNIWIAESIITQQNNF
jgi:hypothetical protein